MFIAKISIGRWRPSDTISAGDLSAGRVAELLALGFIEALPVEAPKAAAKAAKAKATAAKVEAPAVEVTTAAEV